MSCGGEKRDLPTAACNATEKRRRGKVEAEQHEEGDDENDLLLAA